MVSKTPGSPAGNASQPPPLPSVRRIRRRLTRWSEPRSGKATKSVSSPAIDPATSGQRARSRAAAMAWADPGSVRMINRRPASWNSTGRSAMSLRRRSSPDVSASMSRGGSAYAAVPSRVTLIRPSSATSREIVAWVVLKPRSRRAAASSCWVRIGRWSTRSRIARWRSCFMTSIGRPRLSQPRNDDDGSQDEAIDDEDGQGAGPEIAQQEADRQDAGGERGDHPDDQRSKLDRHTGFAGHQLADLEDGRADDDGRRHQERESCGSLASEAREARRRDRDPGSRDARDERQRLRSPDPDRQRERDVLDALCQRSPAVGEPQDDRADDEGQRDRPDVPEVRLDVVAQQEPGERGRDRRGNQQPRQPPIRIATERTIADGRKARRHEPGPVGPEVDEQRGEGPDMQHHAECQ